MKTKQTSKKLAGNQPIPYTLTDIPVPYRVRVDTPSPELRAFVVPRNTIETFAAPPPPIPAAPESGLRLKVA